MVSDASPRLQALETAFGARFVDALDADDLQALPTRILAHLRSADDSDRIATLAMLRAFIGADPSAAPSTPLDAMLPRLRARRRTWRTLRRHAFLPSLGLAPWTIALLWLPIAIGLGLLAPRTYPDFMAFSTFATSALAFGAMVQYATQHRLGWRFPTTCATLGHLADAFVRQGGESLWTEELVAATVRRALERVA